MQKLFFIFFLLTTSSLAMALPLDHTMSMKERLRISLWMEGIEKGIKTKVLDPDKRLPEEIERALRKW